MGIGILEAYLIDHQSLRKLDCLQIIREWLFSLTKKKINPSLSGWGQFYSPPCLLVFP